MNHHSASLLSLRVSSPTLRLKLKQYWAAGALSTLSMLSCACSFLIFGIPTQDYGAMIGAILNHQFPPRIGSVGWLLGMSIFAFIGSVLLPTGYLLWRSLGKHPREILEAILVSGGLWLAIELVAKPLAGDGFFSSSMPYGTYFLFCNLVCCSVYGFSLVFFSQSRQLREFVSAGDSYVKRQILPLESSRISPSRNI